MSPLHLGQIVGAEIIKLQSRSSARVGWVVMALLGGLTVLAMNTVAGATIEVNGAPPAFDLSLANGARWSLLARHFFVAQALILVLGATSFAGEFRSGTLREDLLRPVPRWAVLLAKWISLLFWSASSLLVQLGVTVVVGAVFLSGASTVTWGDVLSAYALTLITEGSFAAVVLLIGTLTRSVSATITATFLFLVIERSLGLLLELGGSLRDSFGPDAMEQTPALLNGLLSAAPYLPSQAWLVAQPVADGTAPDLQSVIALVVITVVAAVGAERVFARTDVP